MPQYWTIKTDDNWQSFCEHIAGLRLAGQAVTLQITKGQRTQDQNSMINTLYGQVAAQAEDLTVIDVRRHCKLHYGVGLLKAASSDFCQFYDGSIKGMQYEQKLLLMDYMDITSRKEFTKKMGTEYIDTIIREYSKAGYSLLHPSEGL